MESTIDETGNEMRMKMTLKIRTKMVMKTQIRTKINRRTQKRRPQTTTTKRTPTPCRKPWTNNIAHEQEVTCGPGNKKVTCP